MGTAVAFRDFSNPDGEPAQPSPWLSKRKKEGKAGIKFRNLADGLEYNLPNEVPRAPKKKKGTNVIAVPYTPRALFLPFHNREQRGFVPVRLVVRVAVSAVERREFRERPLLASEELNDRHSRDRLL